ncbi:macrophage mannose receptor 1-like [Branchiostoma floridae]|uniref:Macrophage mannose receptor 1-like n=1 Tax=Branchiostoma floridae TaxID=7739 RepID=A0A9J7MJT2_BRAFL|nr:macrophage mannose receptor 1-like [Branchiostoma floridae]
MWADGTRLVGCAFTNWAPYEPNNNGGQNCVHMWWEYDYKWDDDFCDYQKYFICQIGSGDESSCNENMDGVCQSGWTEHNSHCYRLGDGPADWDTADKMCKAAGANLASVENDAENNAILSVVGAINTEFPVVWVGLKDVSKGGALTWTDGSPVSYTNWAPHEPENTRTRRSTSWSDVGSSGLRDPGNCIAVYHRDAYAYHPTAGGQRRKGQWKDDFCYHKYLYICERSQL